MAVDDLHQLLMASALPLGDADVFWCCECADAVLSRDWGDEVVVFNETTGGTHLLSAGAASVLDVLMSAPHPLTADELYASVFAAGDEPVEDDRRQLAQLLDEFRLLGLVSRRLP